MGIEQDIIFFLGVQEILGRPHLLVYQIFDVFFLGVEQFLQVQVPQGFLEELT
jgi:hypothetical protein